MKRILMIFALPLILASCGGGEQSATDSNDAASQEAQASDEDMQTVEETMTIESKVEDVNQEVDSILNTLGE
jgi:PBP1b-binding outer membrane lipoprotein LpoB